MGNSEDDSSDVELVDMDGDSSIQNSNVDQEDLTSKLKEVTAELGVVESKISELQAWKHILQKKQTSLRDRLTRNKSSALSSQNWESRTFAWSELLAATCKTAFNIPSFRPLQLAAMNASLSGHDVFLIMPTGGGKSLCYQLPALVEDGVTLVVTPLVSLMEDQVMALKRLEVAAEMLNASSTPAELKRIQSEMITAGSRLKLLYVTPEKMAKSKRFMTKLQKMYQLKRFKRLAIDEVHCCSHWGHDFRPDYKFLGIMKGMFPDVPILGLTATSTVSVLRDVQKILNIKEAVELRAPFNRPNLFYQVIAKPSSMDDCVAKLAKLLKGRYSNQSGIIYTTTVKDTEELARKLDAEGVRAAAYHANLPPDLRSKIHQRWLKDQYQAVVATIAFGMGIDKPNVRFVIHHCLSKSMENYYQESGRAGRDGARAECLMMFRLADVFRLSTMVFTDSTGLEKLYSMCQYCIDRTRCRRRLMAGHFEERWTDADCSAMCDTCSRVKTEPNSQSIVQEDVTKHAKAIARLLQHAQSRDTRVTALKLLDAWFGQGVASLRLKDCSPPAGLSRRRAEDVLAHLLLEGYVKEDFHFTPYSTISYILPGPKDGVYPVLMDVPAKGGDRATSSYPASDSVAESPTTSSAVPEAKRSSSSTHKSSSCKRSRVVESDDEES